MAVNVIPRGGFTGLQAYGPIPRQGNPDAQDAESPVSPGHHQKGNVQEVVIGELTNPDPCTFRLIQA